MIKEEIISEIRRLGKERGGHVSLPGFRAATTGLKERQLLGKHWATWDEAVAEAALTTWQFARPKTGEDAVLGPSANLIERLKKWPTHNDVLLERHRDSSVPTIRVFRRMSKSPTVLAKRAAYCTFLPNLSVAARIATERMEAQKAASPLEGRGGITGYAYLLRSGGSV